MILVPKRCSNNLKNGLKEQRYTYFAYFMHMYAFKCMYKVQVTEMENNLGLHVATNANTYAHDAKKVMK
jgi:hypothetical protein